MKNNNIKNHEIISKVKTAFENSTPNVLDSVLSDCSSANSSQKGKVITMTTKKTFSTFTKSIIALAACMALIFLGVAGYLGITNYTVASTISLDVNPSLEIKVNEQEKVLEVIALNEDAKTVIGNMDFKGSSLELTVNALIGSMLTNGYINDITNSILISIDSRNDSTALRNKLTEEVSTLLHTDSFDGSVISQSITADKTLKELAETYGITIGKTQLINTIIAANPARTFESLVPLSITELNLLLGSISDTQNNIKVEGNASDKAYIGKERALEIVLQHLNLTKDSISDLEIEIEVEKGVICYEIEFDYVGGNSDYDYYVNAVTGDILNEHSSNLDVIPERTNTPTPDIQPSDKYITRDEALSVAYTKASVAATDVRDLSVDFDEDDGIYVYKIDFDANGYEYEIDINAYTGDVVKFEREKEDDHFINASKTNNNITDTPDTDDNVPVDGSFITKETALEIAFARAEVTSADVHDLNIEFDQDDGKNLFEIDFEANGHEYEVDINALTGEIIKFEKEKAD